MFAKEILLLVCTMCLLGWFDLNKISIISCVFFIYYFGCFRGSVVSLTDNSLKITQDQEKKLAHCLMSLYAISYVCITIILTHLYRMFNDQI